MNTVQRNERGIFHYRDGQLHRGDDEPAVIHASGKQEWFRHGKRHRDGDKPAFIGATGTLAWYKDGRYHRDNNQPAVIKTNGEMYWYQNGYVTGTRAPTYGMTPQ